MKFPFKREYTDEKILEILSKGTEEEDQVLRFIYKNNYRIIKRMILEHGGQRSDVEDVFQEAIIVLYEKIKSNQFKLTGTIKAFLYVVAQNIWRTQKKKKSKFTSNEPFEQLLDVPESGENITETNTEITTIVDRIMNELKPDCRMILQLSIYRKLDMKVIAGRMGFKNEQIARNKKNKCLNYLRKILHRFPDYERSLREYLQTG